MARVAQSVFVIAVAIIGCDITREAETYLIPAGYIGWVRIDYGVAGAPPLRRAWCMHHSRTRDRLRPDFD